MNHLPSSPSAALAQRLRRALVACQVQTPEPLLAKVPVIYCYAAAASVLVLLALVSARSALTIRASAHAHEARVQQVQHSNLVRKADRSAVLLAFQQRSVPALIQPEIITAQLAPVAEAKLLTAPKSEQHNNSRMRQAETTIKKSRVLISRSEAKVLPPQSIELALQRLRLGRDDLALHWLMERPSELRGSPDWPVFRHLVSELNHPEQQYQLGVLLDALQEPRKALQWLSSALSAQQDTRHLRAFAIAADKQGLSRIAVDAYRRYVAAPDAIGAIEVQARIAALESP